VISWQRKRFKRYWWKLSQSKRPGRPRMRSEIRKLIGNMAAANPLWGAPRIHGELLKLGVEISERTVSPEMRNIVQIPEVGGLHHRYERRAA
jgi:putative transposase